jgi:hypothetical protein
MTLEEKDGVIWWAIDDALKKASSGFINYESMAREHITELVNEIKDALDRNNLEIAEKVKPKGLKDDTGGFIEKEGKL